MAPLKFDPAHSDVVTWLREWSIHAALPLWATNGLDQQRGGFHECLHLDGTPDFDVPRRTRVQARQIYVYAHAAVLGWYPNALEIAFSGLQFLLDRCRAPDGRPGFIHTIAPDNSIADATRDTYDHAFLLMALSWLARASRDTQVCKLLDDTLAFVEDALAAPDGTYWEGLPHRGPRRQNPHMHMLEAMLAVMENVAHPSAARKSAGLRLSLRKFFHPPTGSIGEYFSEDWTTSLLRDDVVEPGHHAEWVWLLRRHERIAGLLPDPIAGCLLTSVVRASQPHTGFLPDGTDRNGSLKMSTRRCWPQTELAKAWLAEFEHGKENAAQEARKVLTAIAVHYLSGPINGGWIDQFDAHGRPTVTRIPASTLYHLFLAIAEADRVLGDDRCARERQAASTVSCS